MVVWIKIKNVLLEQGWAFAAKAMLLHSEGRAGGRSIYCLAFLPLPPVNPEVDFSPGPNRVKKFPPFPLVNQEIVIADGDCFWRLLTLLNENLGLCLWL